MVTVHINWVKTSVYFLFTCMTNRNDRFKNNSLKFSQQKYFILIDYDKSRAFLAKIWQQFL